MGWFKSHFAKVVFVQSLSNFTCKFTIRRVIMWFEFDHGDQTSLSNITKIVNGIAPSLRALFILPSYCFLETSCSCPLLMMQLGYISSFLYCFSALNTNLDIILTLFYSSSPLNS